MRLTRQEAIRLAGVSSAAAFIGGATLGTGEAWAMNPRFDTTLFFKGGGILNVRGPNNWASDEAKAFISYCVVQGKRVAYGWTWTVAPAAYWSQLASAVGMKPGAATAYGDAIVFNKDGSSESYPWQVAVTLR